MKTDTNQAQEKSKYKKGWTERRNKKIWAPVHESIRNICKFYRQQPALRQEKRKQWY